MMNQDHNQKFDLNKKGVGFKSDTFFFFGEEDGVRTRDLRNHNPAL